VRDERQTVVQKEKEKLAERCSVLRRKTRTGGSRVFEKKGHTENGPRLLGICKVARKNSLGGRPGRKGCPIKVPAVNE